MNPDFQEQIMLIRFSRLYIIFVLALTVHCGRKAAQPPAVQITPVELAAVSREVVSIPIHVVGLASCKQQVKLAFSTGGFVTILVSEGQKVSQGQTLAQLDLAEIEAKAAQARSAFEKAQRDFQRVKNLYEGQALPLEQMQNAETGLRVAESTMRIAEFNLEHSTIKAPSSGTILKKLVESGEMVGPGMPVLYFGSGRNEWEVHAGLADRDVVRLKIGDQAEAQFDAYSGVNFRGSVTEIARAADPQSGVFEVKVKLENIDQPLAVGFAADLALIPSELQEYFVIPIEAVVEANGSTGSVFTVAADTARQVSVTLGPIVDEKMMVSQGLEGISQVITTGASLLRSGDHVQVR
jgi:membrane fusion protein, multidrug efflux system